MRAGAHEAVTHHGPLARERQEAAPPSELAHPSPPSEGASRRHLRDGGPRLPLHRGWYRCRPHRALRLRRPLEHPVAVPEASSPEDRPRLTPPSPPEDQGCEGSNREADRTSGSTLRLRPTIQASVAEMR